MLGFLGQANGSSTTSRPHMRFQSVSMICVACRVLELERLRIADLRSNQEIHECLEAETEMSRTLREALAEHKVDAQQQ